MFVRAGSIIPLGKRIQYTGQLPADTIEIRVYKGADGRYELYEDENDNYNYEKGVFSTIAFTWNDAAHTLKIGRRNGKFPGILRTRIFRIVVVSPEDGFGIDVTGTNQKEVRYTGKEIRIII